MKTTELIGPALDWAVSRCEGVKLHPVPQGGVMEIHFSEPDGCMAYQPSINWSQGGPIIDRACIFIAPTWDGENAGSSARSSRTAWIEGPTALIAAMRCYVASKLGDEVDVPEGLL